LFNFVNKIGNLLIKSIYKNLHIIFLNDNNNFPIGGDGMLIAGKEKKFEIGRKI
jgi:hypothetical protein